MQVVKKKRSEKKGKEERKGKREVYTRRFWHMFVIIQVRKILFKLLRSYTFTRVLNEQRSRIAFLPV